MIKEEEISTFKQAIHYIYELEIKIEKLEKTNAELMKKLTPEAMLDDLGKRYEIYNTCLHCGEGKPAYCEKCYQELIAANLKLQNKA